MKRTVLGARLGRGALSIFDLFLVKGRLLERFSVTFGKPVGTSEAWFCNACDFTAEFCGGEII